MRERPAPFQQSLWNKQVEAYEAIIEALSEVHKAASSSIVRTLGRDWESEVGDSYHVYLSAEERWAFVCSNDVNLSLAAYRKTFHRLRAELEGARFPGSGLRLPSDPSGQLDRAYADVVKAMRRTLSVDPFSEATRSLLPPRLDDSALQSEMEGGP
jgi:hypothetical protein